MDELYLRTQMLLGEEAVERLKRAHVLVLGLGGVGSFAVESLARAGVGALTLVDHDEVSDSNRNRQLCALTSTVGQRKADVLAARVCDINPACRVRPIAEFYSAETSERLLDTDYDYIIDAIDSVTSKVHLIRTAHARGLRIISALGTGNKLDPSLFQITDLSKTSVCPLARVMRRELKAAGIVHHEVLFSTEPPRKPQPLEQPAEGRRSVPGSVSWVPPVAGMMLAGHVIRVISGV